MCIGKIGPDYIHVLHRSIISFCLLSLYKRFEQKANIRGCERCIGKIRCDHTSEYCTVHHFERLFAGDINIYVVVFVGENRGRQLGARGRTYEYPS